MDKKTLRRKTIHHRIRKSVSGTSNRPRLHVFRSNVGIYAQLIDDEAGRTLATASIKEIGDAKVTKSEAAKKVGIIIAEKAKTQGLSDVVFDRGGYLYHGRVKSLAEGAREGGLIF
ncbi:MAG: 50S ribosomal protein L18 [Saprospiraceae bacterium]|nr:50S ribosomal protein L18 [Saprospiraceae bacterium]